MSLALNYWLKGLVGPGNVGADGSETTARFGRQNDFIVSCLKGRYSEQALRGNLFVASLPATTTGVAAGNITGAAAAAVTNFAVWNPVNSGKMLALLKMWIGVISGTPPGGPLLHNLASQVPTIATLLTNGTLQNALPNAPVATVAKAIAVSAGSALTGGGALTAVRPSSLDFSASAFAAAAGYQALEEIDGSIIIPPGYMWVPCWAAAGTSLLNAYGAMWEEIPA